MGNGSSANSVPDSATLEQPLQCAAKTLSGASAAAIRFLRIQRSHAHLVMAEKETGHMSKAKVSTFMDMLAGLGIGSNLQMQYANYDRSKPEFSEEELELIRSLPKKERKAMVKELQQKYRGNNVSS